MVVWSHDLLAGALRVSEISEPSTTVELGKGGLDLACLVDGEGVDALDLLDVVAGAANGDPAPRDLVAAVEDVERLEVEGRLGARAGDEGGLAGEGDGSFLQDGKAF